MGSRHIIRTALQQLTEAGLVEAKELKTVDSEDGERNSTLEEFLQPRVIKCLMNLHTP